MPACGCPQAQPSYEDIVKDCRQALFEQFKADVKGKPDACKDVTKDDYMAIAMDVSLDDLGWTDEDGKFDKNKMLEACPRGVHWAPVARQFTIA
ncbi:hypothetical protein TPA0909_07080 [Streptomyces albus]|nr:hypothetical protein TPA0909_07080 [Streptomyces albus]